tara:strand:- start:1872 stop:5012 length:3141 start_codon:yes stop_codon:yes gene_type:complete
MQQSTPEQQRALALARARKRRAESVQNMTPREAVDAMPSFLTRTADEKAGDQFRNDQRYAAQMFGGLDDQNIRRVATYGDNFLNSATIGNAEGVNSLLDKIGVGGVSMNAPTAEDAKQRTRAFRGELREENPMSALAGEITGYLAPGTVAWKGLAAAGKAVPGAAQLSNLIAKSGRVPNWLARIAGSSALFTADAGLYGATVGASNEVAMTGEDPTLAGRAQTGIDYAKANVGEMGDAVGVDVPTWARGIPISMLLPAAGSVAERSIKGVQSGGKSITPDRVAAEALENVGRAPSPNSTAGAMAEVIPGERITSGTVKTFRFVENALRNGLKDAGLPAAEITDRVTRGFNSIKQSLPALADGSTTLAQLIEREFADAGPQVSENLRLFLLRVGLDDPAVTRGVIQEMRSGQVEDFRNTVNENLGSQRQYDLELSLKQGLRKIGETYDQILNKAKDLGNNSPLANSIREQLTDSKFKFELVEEASKRGWKDVDTFIKQDPWTAAHKLKSKLLSEARAAKASGNYEKYQEPAIYLREMLNELPGYQNLSKRFAEESRVLDTLGYVDTLPNGQKVSTEGFGPKLKKAARSETETLRMGDEFQAMPERQQTAAGISTGQVLKDQLRTARPGGTTLDGQDVMGLRLVDLQNEGMMSTNPEIPGALPQVFGEAGQNISQKADDIVNSRRFLADIDPNTGSNTVNKANAQMGGDAVITSGLPRTMTSGYTQSGLIDATMFASGLPPVATMLTKGIPALGRVLGPGRGTRAEIARTLMQRPARTGPPPTPPPPIAPLTGRNRPRKWRKDPKWSDPNLTNPQIEAAPQNAPQRPTFGKRQPEVDPIAEAMQGDDPVSNGFTAPPLATPDAPRKKVRMQNSDGTPTAIGKIYELSQSVNPETGKLWTRAEIADEMLISRNQVSVTMNKLRNAGYDAGVEPSVSQLGYGQKTQMAVALKKQGLSNREIANRINAVYGKDVVHGGTDTTEGAVSVLLSKERGKLRNAGELVEFGAGLMLPVAAASMGALNEGESVPGHMLNENGTIDEQLIRAMMGGR